MDIQKELIEEFEIESSKTRKMLEAIPEEANFSWRPHAKSMPLGKLAEHVAGVPGEWALGTLTKDKVEWDGKSGAEAPANKAALLESFDRDVAKSKEALAAIVLEKWDANWKFVFGEQVWLNGSKYRIWREDVINHMIHHRGQLGTYLRLLDAKIPGCYGPSADEM